MILLSEMRGPVLLLRLNRPEKRNALSMALCAAVVEALRAAEEDAAVSAVVLAGEGAGFCAGGDLEERRCWPTTRPPGRRGRRWRMRCWPRRAPWPSRWSPRCMARVVGMGASLMLGCDMVVAAEDALLTGRRRGTGSGRSSSLPQLLRHLGPKDAFEVLATGRTLDAAEARALRLVNRVVPRDALLEEACALAAAAAAYGPENLRGIKAMIDAAGIRR